MKIRHDGSGNINACTIDSVPLGGATVVSIADNYDLLSNPGKYTYISSVLALKKYVKLTTSAPLVSGVPTEPADGTTPLPVTITAYTPGGSVDTSATYAVSLSLMAPGSAPSAPVSVTLVAGVGSHSFTSSSAKKAVVLANSTDVFGDNLAVAFA